MGAVGHQQFGKSFGSVSFAKSVSPSHTATMSVAFTKESDAEAVAANLPDRPVPAHTNLVTPNGLVQIESALTAARAAYDSARATAGISENRSAMAVATRDLRYWSARRASAQLVESTPIDASAGFGSTVTFDRTDGRRQSYRIVGDDEANPAQGSVSYVSPLARAVTGKRVGEWAILAGQDLEIVAIS